MEVSEFVDALDLALAKRRVRYPLELVAPTVLGQRGRYLGDGRFGPRFGYRRRQCKIMRAEIRRAAEADALAMDAYEPEAREVGDTTTSPEDQ